jgi:hypothetical protein
MRFFVEAYFWRIIFTVDCRRGGGGVLVLSCDLFFPYVFMGIDESLFYFHLLSYLCPKHIKNVISIRSFE